MEKEKYLAYLKLWRQNHPDYARNYARTHKINYSKFSKKWREKHSYNYTEYLKNNPEKYLRHLAVKTVYDAIKKGKLIRQPCEICGEIKTEGHHPDYSKPLEVKWLCRKHHCELHRKIKLSTTY